MARRTSVLLLLALTLVHARALADCPLIGSVILHPVDPLVVEVDVERTTPLANDACRVEGQARILFPARWDVQRTTWAFADDLVISVDWANGSTRFAGGVAIGELSIDKKARTMSVVQPLSMLTVVAVDGEALHTMQFFADDLFGAIRPRRISWAPAPTR